MAKVVFKFQDTVLKEVPIEADAVTIGRKPDNAIAIDNLAVSGFHAKIFKEGSQYFVEDMESLNGTFLNGSKVKKSALKNGDVILIGKHFLVLDLPEVPETAQAAPVKKEIKMDETIVLDSALQQRMLEQAAQIQQKPSGEKEITGGLAVIAGRADQNYYDLKDRVTTIGKEQNAAIRLKGFFAPKVGALVNRKKDGYYITAVDGAVKVNNRKIIDKCDLKEGDIVEVGKLKFQFYVVKK